MSRAHEIDSDRCEALVERALDGHSAARKELIEYLWPHWVRIASSHHAILTLRNKEDAVHDVAARLVEKIGREDGHGLALYAAWRARNDEKTFADWMRVVVANAVRDHVRGAVGKRPEDGCDEPSLKRLLNEFSSSRHLERIGVRPPMTAAQTALELVEFAERRLTPDQLAALRAWMEGEDVDEIAARLALEDAAAAKRLLRAAVAVLRRKFAEED